MKIKGRIMTMKKVISVAVIIALCFGLSSCMHSLKSRSHTDLSQWVGSYIFSEYAKPNINMDYRIDIKKGSDGYYADISIDGFQTMTRLKAKVADNIDSVKLVFESYLPGNGSELYKKGDVLLTLRKDGEDILTDWGKMEPLLPENKGSGKIYFKKAEPGTDENVSSPESSGENVMAEGGEDITLESISGTWYIKEFIGTLNIYTDEEDENTVVGKKIIIASDGVYYGSEKIISKPKLAVTTLTYDDVLVNWNADPELFGMKIDNNVCRTKIHIMDEIMLPSKIGISFVVIDKNQMIYLRNSKFYRVIRTDK